jgi:hypothetical protein
MATTLRQEASDVLHPDDTTLPAPDRALAVLLAAHYSARRPVGTPAHAIAEELPDLPEIAVDHALLDLTATGHASVLRSTGGYAITTKGLHHAAGLLVERAA